MDTLDNWLLSTIVIETILICAVRLANDYKKREESIVNTIIEIASELVIIVAYIHIFTIIETIVSNNLSLK